MLINHNIHLSSYPSPPPLAVYDQSPCYADWLPGGGCDNEPTAVSADKQPVGNNHI